MSSRPHQWFPDGDEGKGQLEVRLVGRALVPPPGGAAQVSPCGEGQRGHAHPGNLGIRLRLCEIRDVAGLSEGTRKLSALSWQLLMNS